MDVIIFGAHGYNTLGTVRCFAEKGVPFFLLLVRGAKAGNQTHRCKGVTAYHIVDTSEEGLDWLLSHSEQMNGSLIFPTGDKQESLLDTHLGELTKHYTFPNARRQGEINRLMDKSLQAKLALETGLTVPWQLAIESTSDLSKVEGAISFPCIIKNEMSINGSKSDMQVCHNREELAAAIAALHPARRVLVQQYVQMEHELLLIGCSLPSGRIIIPGIVKKLRWCGIGQVDSYSLVSTQVEKHFSQVEEVKRFITKTGYKGTFSVEFGVENDKAYFFEVNLRNDGTSHYFHPAGLYLPYLYWLDCQGRLTDDNFKLGESQEYYFIDEFMDVVNIFNSTLTFRRWYHDLRHAKAFATYVTYDKRVFFRQLPMYVVKVIYEIFQSALGNRK